MRILLSFIILVLSSSTFAQDHIKTSYFKDQNLWKKSSEKTAKYKKVEREKDDLLYVEVIQIKNNLIIESKTYDSGKPVGVWESYDSKGQLISKRDFGKMIYRDSIFKDENENFELASYGTSQQDLFTYLGKNIIYPNEAKDAGISGKVYIQLIINKDGNAEPVAIISDPQPFLDYEAWTLIENMPNWNPATKDGMPIDSYFTLPINFILH